MVLSEIVKQRALNNVLVYLARTKATNFQRVILMGAKATPNKIITLQNWINKHTSKINILLITPYCLALLYWHNLSVLYKAKIASA
ncbi:hypothetical protein Kyoto25A_03990 [Helicobacter pylori]|nr:hypothetical protein JP0070_03210 [Helicobacter pylori]